MPSIHRIRKEVLQALDDAIIPALWQQAFPVGYVDMPLKFPPGVSTEVLSKAMPRVRLDNVDFPLLARWPQAHLHSSRYPYMGFLYEGTAEERTLVTPAQAGMFHLSKGIHAIRWPAPGALMFPPGTPHNDGTISLWRGPAPLKILWMKWSNEILLHTHIFDGSGPPYISHSLQVDDPSICSLLHLFVEELKQAREGDQQVAQGMLLALLLRLQKQIRRGAAKIANTSRAPLPAADATATHSSVNGVCQEVAIYIQMHLHEPLSLSGIARQADFSPVHLNRLFRQNYGMSVMRYVRSQRIVAASNILVVGNESMAEVAQLVGFKRANVFSHAFQQQMGLSPGQYRRQAKHNKTSPPV